MMAPFSRRTFLHRAALLSAAAASPAGLFAQGAVSPKRVILDLDIGIDDAFALLFAHYSPAIELVGVTTLFGNTTRDKSARNGLYIKERFGIEAQVYRGAAAALYHPLGPPPAFVHGEDGLGDTETIEPTIEAADLPAAEFIARTIMDNPGEITVVAVGPMTNLALARLAEPAIVDNVRDVVVMGGAIGFDGELGNATTVGEANAWNDAHAMDSLFRHSWPVTMVGLDITYAADAAMGPGYLGRLRDDAGDAGLFLERISRQYRRFYKSSRGVDTTFQHDSLAVAYAIAPELFEVRRGKVKVVTDGVARGQTIFCPEGHHNFDDPEWADRPAHTVCSGIDGAGFLDLYRSAVAAGATS
ncbi:MAG: nucleoside hydrolase [Thermoanaerobaculia bacterium]